MATTVQGSSPDGGDEANVKWLRMVSVNTALLLVTLNLIKGCHKWGGWSGLGRPTFSVSFLNFEL